MMRVAVVGSRQAPANADELVKSCLPPDTTEIISGGATGMDTAAQNVARQLGIPCTVILPDYDAYGKRAPLIRNDAIIDRADMVLAFWDGESHGTRYVIGRCLERARRVLYIPIEKRKESSR